jgi:hypothetical protein
VLVLPIARPVGADALRRRGGGHRLSDHRQSASAAVLSKARAGRTGTGERWTRQIADFILPDGKGWSYRVFFFSRFFFFFFF